MLSTFPELKSYICEHRDCGIVHVHLWSRTPNGQSPRDAADELVVSLGFRPPRDRWKSIARLDAQRVISHILHEDLAYGSEMIRRETAEHIAERFALLFHEHNSYCFTNCDVTHLGRSGFSWHPITDSTFDCGIVMLDDVNAGLIWVEDED